MAWSSASSLRAAPQQWQGHDISYDERAWRDATAAPGRSERVGGGGQYRGPPRERASRDATAAPGRPERRGVWGPFRGPQFQLGGSVAATKIKVIELAKELGVTSKDLMVAAEEMGHKGVRAMTPLDQTLANELRTKLGKGRELPEEPVKPKRVAKPKAPKEDGAAVDGAEIVAKKPRAKKAKPADAAEEVAAAVKPAATIVKPKPVEITGEPPAIVAKQPEIAPEPSRVAPVTPPPPAEPVKPAAAAAGPAAPPKPEPKIVPFRPLERPAPPPPPSRPSRQPA